MTDVHSFSQTPLLFLTFLQQRPSLNSELQRELENLRWEVKRQAQSGIECDGELQADGHSLSRVLLQDVPQVGLVLPVHAEDSHAVREVAAELIRMADEFNQLLIHQHAERLTKKLTGTTSPTGWWRCLSQGVDGLLRDMPGAHSERMVMALTFSLARAVCERAPRLLRNLINTMMHYTSVTRPR